MAAHRRDELRARLNSGPALICDGGMGAELRKRGWTGPTEDANVHAPQTVEEIHRAFRQAGAEILLTNTFMMSRRGEHEVAESLAAAVARVRAVAAGAFVVGSLGPFEDPDSLGVGAIARAFARSGVDGLFFETQFRVRNQGVPRRAIRDIVESFEGPVLVSFVPGSFDATEIRAWAGREIPASIGLNCGDGPATLLQVARDLRQAPLTNAHVPLSLRPSAGLPVGLGRALQYPVTPDELAAFGREAVKLGARIIGGCCGASPAHIAALAKAVREVEEVSEI